MTDKETKAGGEFSVLGGNVQVGNLAIGKNAKATSHGHISNNATGFDREALKPHLDQLKQQLSETVQSEEFEQLNGKVEALERSLQTGSKKDVAESLKAIKENVTTMSDSFEAISKIIGTLKTIGKTVGIAGTTLMSIL